jgi:hypothetical protein
VKISDLDKGRILVAFDFALLGYTFSMEGIYFLLGITITGILAILALMILVKDRLPNKWRKYIEDISQSLDVSWAALGLGLIGFGTKSIQFGIQQKNDKLIWLSFIIFLLAALCIGAANGRSGRKLLEYSTKLGAIASVLFIIIAGISLILSWISFKSGSFLTKINSVAGQLTYIGIGIILLFMSFKMRKKRKWTYENDFDFDDIYE